MPTTQGTSCNGHAMRCDSQAWIDESVDGDGVSAAWPGPQQHHIDSCSSSSSSGAANTAAVVWCRGIEGGSNEVLYLGQEEARGNVVLFPGDVQDLHHRMISVGHEEFSDYCVESTARTIARRFPGHAVWVVLPKTHVHGALASYDNFAKTDWATGGAVLEYLPDGSACEHLEALLGAAADAVHQEDDRFGVTTSRRPDISLPLTLVGFSKGVVVLNQLVTELACSPPPVAAAPALPKANSSTRSGVDGDGIKLAGNRKRSRVSMSNSRRCSSSCGGGGGERLACSEGDLTNPPSPADDGDIGATMGSSNWPMGWEGGRDEERREDAGGTGDGTPHDGVQDGYKPHQDKTGSLWSRLWSAFGMSRLKTRTISSTSLPSASSTDESPNDDDLDQENESSSSSSYDPTPPSTAEEAPRGGGCCDGPLRWRAEKRRRRRNRPTSISGSTPPGEQGDSRGGNTTCIGGGTLRGSDVVCERGLDDDSGSGAANRLFGRVAAVHWVDGANAAVAGSFPTNLRSLARLAALPNLSIRVHGTPYQWSSQYRPWLASEATAFLASVEGFRRALRAREEGSAFATKSSTTAGRMSGGGDGGEVGVFSTDAAARGGGDGLAAGVAPIDSEGSAGEGSKGGGSRVGGAACDVKRLVYFENEQPSLENHFRVLAELNTK
ncbi:unnamed protein product [Ectocarpus sp. 12 AP-2014]